MVISLCKGLQPLLAEKYLNLKYTFAYAAVWALGGALAEKDGHNYRKDFSSFFKNEFKSVKWPTKGTVFDYFFENLENGVKLEEWKKIGHFKKFKQNVQEQSKPIITATLQLHAQVCSLFKKIAFKFHYEFNIRHIAGIFQGLLMAAPTLPAQYGQASQSFGEDKIVMLWAHESERVYGDRLVKVEHLEKFKNALSDIAKKNFPKVPLNKHLAANAESLIFCNFPLGIMNDRYLDKIDLKTLEDRVNEALKYYNDNYAVMDLVLFEDAMRHVTKITRIISQPSGHVLLVGVGGSGKQSLARLASHICTYSTFQITISQTYGMNELKKNLSTLYTKSGMKEEGILFFFTDGQITSERFLVYTDDLLSSGEVADLYAPEDKDNIINQIRAKVKSAGVQDSCGNCWNYYIDRVKVQSSHGSLLLTCR